MISTYIAVYSFTEDFFFVFLFTMIDMSFVIMLSLS